MNTFFLQQCIHSMQMSALACSRIQCLSNFPQRVGIGSTADIS